MITAYYARPNALARLLPEPQRTAFLSKWSSFGRGSIAGPQRSALAGDVAAVVLPELELADLFSVPMIETGIWFQYSGSCRFSPREASAIIEAPDMDIRLTAKLRRECFLTQTAHINMDGHTAEVTQVGVLTSQHTYELVLAGWAQSPSLARLVPSGDPQNARNRLRNALMSEDPVHDLGLLVPLSLENLEKELIFGPARRMFSKDPIVFAEERFGNLYEFVCDLCFPDEITLIREPVRSANRVDFLLVHGTVRHAIEIKQISDASGVRELLVRLKNQLPTYMTAYRATIGWFVVFVQGSITDNELRAISQRLNDSVANNSQVHVEVVDARPQTVASKRRDVAGTISRS